MPNWEAAVALEAAWFNKPDANTMKTWSHNLGRIGGIGAIPGVAHVIPRQYLMASGMMKFGNLEPTPMSSGSEQIIFQPRYEMASGSSELRKGTILVGEEF